MIVIGGGDTGTDCVGTCLRHGCRSVTSSRSCPRPPDERAADNPWPEWPRVYTHRLRTGRGSGALRPRPARVCHLDQALRRRRERAASRKCTPCGWQWQRENGRMVFQRCARHANRSGRPNWCCWPWASSAPSKRCSGQLGVEPDARSNVTGRPRPVTPPACPGCLRPATCGAGRAWSSGRSTKDGQRHASAMRGCGARRKSVHFPHPSL